MSSSFYPNFHEYCLWALRGLTHITPWFVGLVVNIKRVGTFQVTSINGVNEDQKTIISDSNTIIYMYSGNKIVADSHAMYQITLQRYESQKLGGGRSKIPAFAKHETVENIETHRDIFKSADGDAPSTLTEYEEDNVAKIDPSWYEKWEK